MSKIVDKIQKSSVRQLNQLVQNALSTIKEKEGGQLGALRELAQQADAIQERFVTSMNYNFDVLMDREEQQEEVTVDFESLSLVKEEELDGMVALNGMINSARNQHLSVIISFNTRLGFVLPEKHIDESSNPLDPAQVGKAFQEAIRPIELSADNSLTIFRAFNLDVLGHLDDVLNDANKLLMDSGEVPDLAVEAAKKPRNQPAARSQKRGDAANSFGTIEEDPYDEEETPELFSMMQNLMHTEVPSGPVVGGMGGQVGGPINAANPGQQGTFGPAQTMPVQQQQYMIPAGMIPATGGVVQPGQLGVMQSFQPAEGQRVEMVDQAKLMEILTNIQATLQSNAPTTVPTTLEEVEQIDISQSLGDILQETNEDAAVVSAVDRQSSDVINLVTLLYEAIWDDHSVPIPIKELIGRTQITIIKVALGDVTFFNNETHPARVILNEFAAAGIGWTEVEELAQDPLYKEIQHLVDRILSEYTDDVGLFEELIEEFKVFRITEAAKTRQLEQRILKAKGRKERLDGIRELVTQKIEERILGRDLHPFVDNLLHVPFHKFMEMLVLKEGPGTNAWKQAINTIDVLLWTVQSHDQVGDRGRLDTVNARLLNNLRKAFRIASIEKEEIDTLITTLVSVQEETFSGVALEGSKTADETDEATSEDDRETTDSQLEKPPEVADGLAVDSAAADSSSSQDSLGDPIAFDMPSADKEPSAGKQPSEEAAAPEAVQDSYTEEVENLTVGVWVEFVGEDDNNTRCKLAAEINAIDKFIFVNRQGVKVVEKTKMGLAAELREGTVSIISDGLLFSRALESVIGNLRESQLEQQTGSAYQPAQ